MVLRVVPYYGAGLALLFIVLSVNVIRHRGATRVALGTGGDPILERRARVQANFAEYVPLALLLLAMAELRGTAPWLLHLLGGVLLLGRLSHAWGMSQSEENLRFRATGMAATFGVLTAATVILLLG